MKYFAYALIFLPLLSAVLYGAFGITWWEPIAENSARQVVMISIHLGTFISGAVMTIHSGWDDI